LAAVTGDGLGIRIAVDPPPGVRQKLSGPEITGRRYDAGVTTVAEALRGALPPPTPDPEVVGGVAAAVVVPVVDGPRPRLLLTRRTDTVRDHKGEISFPGGVWHEDDRDLLATALRETREELGIASSSFEVLGRLPETHTIVSGYVIVPFVGILVERPAMTPSPLEIAEILEMDLGRLAGVERQVIPGDRPGGWFAYELDGNTVWGATGRILHGFLEALREGGWTPEEG
jgi:8-oxo-dGTP pyrophosphatase MutT (NUDIX family)